MARFLTVVSTDLSSRAERNSSATSERLEEFRCCGVVFPVPAGMNRNQLQ
jgi:hypothetical protein